MRDVPSPDNWVDLGWYFAVSAALQRRVWYGDLNLNPTFVNLYAVLIGPPASGKGLVISPIKRMLTDKRMRKNSADRGRDPLKGEQIPLKIPLGPDDGSYQAIMDVMAENTTTFRSVKDGESHPYLHCSLAIILDEMNSLFKKNGNEAANFLLKTFDCQDHTYKVRHSTSNVLTKTCVALFAGCTNTMLQDAVKFGIFDDGFVSRCIFAFEFAPKFYKFGFNLSYDDSQKKDFDDLVVHLERLTGMYGQLEFTPEAFEYLSQEHDRVDVPKIARSRAKMLTYYGRKSIQVMKLAAIVQCSTDFSLKVGLPAAMEARRLLDAIEPKMAAGFNSIGRNDATPLYNEVGRKIASSPAGMSLAELLLEFKSELTFSELQELLTTLILTCEIKQQGDRYYGK